jgi:hypothetical protein
MIRFHTELELREVLEFGFGNPKNLTSALQSLGNGFLSISTHLFDEIE